MKIYLVPHGLVMPGMIIILLCGLLHSTPTWAEIQSSSDSKQKQVELKAPSEHHILFTGQRTTIKVLCRNVSDAVCVAAKPRDEDIVRLVNKEVHFSGNDNDTGVKDVLWRTGHDGTVTAQELPPSQHHHPREGVWRLMGVRPGRTELDVVINDKKNSTSGPFSSSSSSSSFSSSYSSSSSSSSSSALTPLGGPYLMTVVDQINVVEDVFLYVLYMSQTLTLLMLGFRMRRKAVKEVLVKPCGLIAALLCQTMLVPLVTLGASMSLDLDPHYSACLLLIGCCPTAVISPMFAVLQHAHVELAILLLALETTVAFGVIPLWLFTYGHFLGLAYEGVSLPYLHVAGALGAVSLPVIIGAGLQRCAPRALPHMDKAIHPTCLLLTLTASTVSAYNVWKIWYLVTWKLLLATVMVPAVGCLVGALATAMFRQKLSEVKSVSIVTGLQNTLLATVLLQTSYPTEDASLMNIAVICLEFTTLCYMYVGYILHLILWIWVPYYRSLHDNPGISGLYRSIAEKIVKSMIKAGEITLKIRSGNSSPATKNTGITLISQTSSLSEPTSSPTLSEAVAREAASQGFSTLGIRNKIFANAFESVRPPASHIPPPSPPPPLEADDNLPPPTPRKMIDLAMMYFGMDDTSTPAQSGSPSSQKLDKESLSIDYELLSESKTPGFRRKYAVVEDGDSTSGIADTNGPPSGSETHSTCGSDASETDAILGLKKAAHIPPEHRS